MHIYPEHYEEYVNRHNPIWAELKTVLKNHGAHNYSIFLDKETFNLFAYVEVESEEEWDNIASTEVCQKWWKYMSALMETNADDSPVTLELQEVFYLK